MNPIIFEIQNLILILIILFLTTKTLYKNFKSKNYYKFWSPLTFISLVYIYYTIIGALVLLSNDILYLGVNLTVSATYSWLGAVVSLLSIHSGFLIYRGYSIPFLNLNLNNKKAFKTGIILFLIGLLNYSAIRGFNLSIVQSSSKLEFNDGGLAQFFINCVSLLVLASILLIPTILKNKYRLYYSIPIVLSFIVFIISGFRYRLVYLVIAMATMYYLFTKKRIKIWFWIIFSFSFILFMGIMGVSRGYSQGLDLSKTEGLDLASTALEAVNEANTFFVTGSVIENTIKSGDYLYFEPLVTAIAMPLPRSIFPGKPSGDYLKKIQRDLFGSDQYGAAFLNYGEAFLSFGWIGIFIHGL